MSVSCQERKSLLLDKLVSAGEELGRHCKAKRFHGFEVDHQLVLGYFPEVHFLCISAERNPDCLRLVPLARRGISWSAGIISYVRQQRFLGLPGKRQTRNSRPRWSRRRMATYPKPRRCRPHPTRVLALQMLNQRIGFSRACGARPSQCPLRIRRYRLGDWTGSALPSRTDIGDGGRDVRFVPISDIRHRFDSIAIR
jgi:hypothetical protein